MAGSEYTTEQEQAAAVDTPSTGRTAPASTVSTGDLLISLPHLTPDALDTTLGNIASALPQTAVNVTAPDATNGEPRGLGPLTLVPYTPETISSTPWLLTAADFLNLFQLVRRHNADHCLVLGAETQTLTPSSIRALADGIRGNADLVTPRYDLRPREGLINSAILYPVSRALYGARPRFPLAIDLALSRRMAERLAGVAQRHTAAGQPDAPLWPVAEAATAGFTVTEVNAGARTVPQSGIPDLTSIINLVAGSLFADVEAKAAFWQRSRATQPQTLSSDPGSDDASPDIGPMLDSFRLAYTNLREIWSLVLPPQGLLGLKKLSLMPAETFRMPASLWARTVYDFILAYRLRTLNRGHLLGAMSPLYLAWVASHLNLTHAGTPAEQHVEETAAAFETEKPYLVSRWRWPDRFNP